MIQPERVKPLNRGEARKGDFVLYWMQASQRTRSNHALEYSIEEANRRSLPLIVYFGLTDKYPEANLRHYAFMLEGLAECKRSLAERGIRLVVRHQSPEVGVVEMAEPASLVIVDRGYTRIERKWRESAALAIVCPFVQVETNVVVPVEVASPKEEFSARTFRPKIKRALPRFLVPVKERQVKKDSLGLRMDALSLDDIDLVLDSLSIDRSVGRVSGFKGGTSQAIKRLEEFVEKKLKFYAELRNDPMADCLSGMSPYLHFGQISPVEIALEVMKKGGPGADAYLEELIVRRELSMNFVYYNSLYDKYEGLPRWARETLDEHRRDKREAIYSRRELEEARTADPYWNAAQTEMMMTGKMHGYMRMYWGKRIVQWTERPKEAFRLALYLNNKYELDGRDANGFAGVAWCFGKHDRPWPSRSVFGKVRSMAASGLVRKFDANAYAKKFAVQRSERQSSYSQVLD